MNLHCSFVSYRIVQPKNMNSEQIKIPFSGILIYLTFCQFAAVQSELVEFPRNTVILEHKPLDTIDMSCKSNYQERLRWDAHKNDDTGNEIFYNGYYLRPDAKSYCTAITDEPGKCYLRFRNTAEVAKSYICVEPGSLREASADLIWIRSSPVCSSSSTEDLVNLTCSIEFRGNWAPAMEWKERSIQGDKVLSVGVNTVTVRNERVTSRLVMPVHEGRRTYTCTTKFVISAKPPATTATNVPDYIEVWTASLLLKTDDLFGQNSEEETVGGIMPNDMEDRRHILLLICGLTAGLFVIMISLLLTFVLILTIKRNRARRENQRHCVKGDNDLVPKETAFESEKPSEVKCGLPSSRTLLIGSPHE